MPKPKKDGEKVSLYVDKSMMESFRAYADEKDQTLTMAMKRLLTAKLDEETTKIKPPIRT